MLSCYYGRLNVFSQDQTSLIVPDSGQGKCIDLEVNWNSWKHHSSILLASETMGHLHCTFNVLGTQALLPKWVGNRG